MILSSNALVSVVLLAVCIGSAMAMEPSAQPGKPAAQAGKPADIAGSAYQYRSDRPADKNPPESWVLLMQHAGLPYDKPVDRAAPAVKRVLCGLLWEEVRPLRRLELTWPAGTRNRPSAEDLEVTCFDATDDTAHTWWNPRSLKTLAQPEVSADGQTYSYVVPVDTWGVVVALREGGDAKRWSVPEVRALGEDRWQSMQVEVEWGYEPERAKLNYDGRVEAYDGVVSGLSALPHPRGEGVLTPPAPLSVDGPHPRPLSTRGEGRKADEEARTVVTGPQAWRSSAGGSERRGVRFDLLYIGRSGWRRTWPYAAQQEDVARTIVTVWTRSGSFSFLAADLEQGPILAPEYGFFVRATRVRRSPAVASTGTIPPPAELLTTRMDEIAGVPLVRGWANNLIPWFGVNPTDRSGSAGSLTIPAHCAAMHPLPDRDVAVAWRAPVPGTVIASGRVAMADAAGGNGADWSVVCDGPAGRRILARGQIGTGGAVDIESTPRAPVALGDTIALVVGARDHNYMCDTTIVELAIHEQGGDGRTWSLTRDVADSIHAGNPHADTLGHRDVWWFFSPPAEPSLSQPPFAQASRARSARGFLRELNGRGLQTIRTRTRLRPDQSWEGAVQAMHPEQLPPYPTPELEPAMAVEVPDARLTAQWRLGAWHILRRSLQDKTGQWHFNDYPFGVLASETYLILRALDLQGMHKEAADGLQQWLSLPMQPKVTPGQGGQHPWSKPDRPLGLFSDGEGCLTLAEGIEGAGGHMDGVHAMGPGAIMFALTEHYRLTGDEKWLRAAAPRMLANARWILRQRQLLTGVVPGGQRMWSRGLQPAHVVTPDSMCMHMQFYESEAYYWLAVKRMAELLTIVSPSEGKQLAAEAEAYRKDLRAAVERSIALTPVVAVRDGTYHSFIPFAPYVRGFASGAWGWRRCQGHVGAIYWDTVQSADPLVSPAGLLPADDPRVQGHLDVLEDRLLLENPKLANRTPDYDPERDWFAHASWQYQCGLERHANISLAEDDVPCFLRTWLNQYAVDIMPGEYTFREHTTGGPPDKLFEESAFLERFRMALVMEQGDALWLARATPRAWLEQGKRIAVRNAPTWFGPVSYEIVSDVDHGVIRATVAMPARRAPKEALLRLRHPSGLHMQSVTVNGKPWRDFSPAGETVRLAGLAGEVHVEVRY